MKKNTPDSRRPEASEHRFGQDPPEVFAPSSSSDSAAAEAAPAPASSRAGGQTSTVPGTSGPRRHGDPHAASADSVSEASAADEAAIVADAAAAGGSAASALWTADAAAARKNAVRSFWLRGRRPRKKRLSRRDYAPLLISLLLIVLLWFLPTGFEGRLLYQGSDKTTARILSVNNEQIVDNGLLRTGEQSAVVRLEGGRFRGQKTDAFNHLVGSLGKDKIFKAGDRARVVVDFQGDKILAVNLIDHDRMPQELVLFGVFFVFLLLVAGRTGFRAILTFVLSVLVMWKFLVPQILHGSNPIVLGLLVVSILTILIISSVFGFSRRSLAAVGGALSGILLTFILSLLTTRSFLIHGAVMPQSESLIYAGFSHLNLTEIFMATIFIGASGAIMDLAVDITSAVSEVVSKKPSIKWPEAFRSASNVGTAAMGTMTTTLLLAYSGGYLVLMMVFMAQGTPLMNILNYKEVAAEIIHTLVGSLGLVSVVPFTALLSAILLTRPQGKKEVLEALAGDEFGTPI